LKGEIEMRGAGFLAIWSDVEQKALTDCRHWLTREHTTEGVTKLALHGAAPEAGL
jgi:hypothetical protein